ARELDGAEQIESAGPPANRGAVAAPGGLIGPGKNEANRLIAQPAGRFEDVEVSFMNTKRGDGNHAQRCAAAESALRQSGQLDAVRHNMDRLVRNNAGHEPAPALG